MTRKSDSSSFLVVDANILVRAILGRRVRELLETYFSCQVGFVAPDVAFDDAQEHLPDLLRERGKPTEDVPDSIEYLKTLVEPIEASVYGLYEEEARRRLRGRDEEDWPVLATALALEHAVWTEDQDFFGTGVATWTTRNVEDFLRAQQGPVVPYVQPRSRLPYAQLGPLAPLTGSWKGSGLNAMWRPDNPQSQPVGGQTKRFLELTLTGETLDFHVIPGVVPNRGLNLQPDLSLYGLHYLQLVTYADPPPFQTRRPSLAH